LVSGLCKLCDLVDWENAEFLDLLDKLHLSFGREQKHRKHWEFAQAILGLRRLGCVTPTALAIGVGAGNEHPIYYLANHVRKVHATDIYGSGAFAGINAMAEMLVHPERFAPFPYREDHLVTQYMDGRDLKYADGSFDFAFSLSSIEHFGGHPAATRAMQEIARVLRPGGIAAITTELILNGVPHPEYFRPAELDTHVVRGSGLALVEEIDFRFSSSLLEKPLDLSSDVSGVFPHIVCKVGPVVFTSVLLVLRKPG